MIEAGADGDSVRNARDLYGRRAGNRAAVAQLAVAVVAPTVNLAAHEGARDGAGVMATGADLDDAGDA